MTAVLVALLSSLRAGVRSRVALQLEVLALRHQLAAYQRGQRRARTRLADRLLSTRYPCLRLHTGEPREGPRIRRLLRGSHSEFKVLFVFIVLAHTRRRVVHFNITEHQTAHWTSVDGQNRPVMDG